MWWANPRSRRATEGFAATRLPTGNGLRLRGQTEWDLRCPPSWWLSSRGRRSRESHSGPIISDNPAFPFCRAGTKWPKRQRGGPCRENRRTKSRGLGNLSRKNQAGENRSRLPRWQAAPVLWRSPNADGIRRGPRLRKREASLRGNNRLYATFSFSFLFYS